MRRKFLKQPVPLYYVTTASAEPRGFQWSVARGRRCARFSHGSWAAIVASQRQRAYDAHPSGGQGRDLVSVGFKELQLKLGVQVSRCLRALVIAIAVALVFWCALINGGMQVSARPEGAPELARFPGKGIGPASPEPSGANPLRACGVLSKGGAVYRLENDVSSAGTCFSVQADKISLDLNGHTLRYGTGGGQQPRYGVLGEACWDTGVAGNPCGGSADHLTVENGKIVQDDAAPPYSHGIRLGQLNGANHLTVRKVEFEIKSVASIPIFTTFTGADSQVANCTFRNDVKEILNRHQIQGASIKFMTGQDAHNGQIIHDNNIIGGAQGGIYSASPGTLIYNNSISQNGRYSNDFGIYLWGNRSEAYNNTITPISGRGVQISGGAVGANGQGRGSAGAVAHDNQITVMELRQNCDYSSGGKACDVCEPGGAYGIQFDDQPTEGVAYKNTVRARAGQCDAQALRLTDIGTGNTSHDNQFIAERVGQDKGKAWALGTGGASNHFVATNDSFTADSATFHADWDGMPGGLTCVRCTLAKGPQAAADYVTFSFENGGRPVNNLHFQDSTFTGGAAKNSTDMRGIGSSRQYAEYYIDWTYTLTIKDGSNASVPGATVTITDTLQKEVFSGSTDKEGVVSAVLTEFKAFNTTKGVVRESHSPYLITVRAQGCTPNPHSFTVALTQRTNQTIPLACVGGGKTH